VGEQGRLNPRPHWRRYARVSTSSAARSPIGFHSTAQGNVLVPVTARSPKALEGPDSIFANPGGFLSGGFLATIGGSLTGADNGPPGEAAQEH
jgi:hypothetical protein